MASGTFNRGAEAIQNGGKDFLTDVLKFALIDDTYTFDPDDTAADVLASELDVTGYTPGFASASRKTLASKTVTRDDVNNRVVHDAADPSAYSALGAGASIKGVLVYFHDTDDATSIPLFWGEYAAPIPTNGGDFSHVVNAGGLGYTQQ